MKLERGRGGCEKDTRLLWLKLIGTSKLRNRDPIGTQLFMKYVKIGTHNDYL